MTARSRFRKLFARRPPTIRKAPAGGDFSGINFDGALVASSGAGVTLIQGRGGNDPSLPA
jgi:hypothetical protein